MYDSHIHTAFSADCDTPIEEVLQSAVNMKLKTITITDHIDYKYHDSIKFEFDPVIYDETISHLQRSYKDKIEILKGVELGLKPDIIDMCKTLMENHDFDFIIASMHGCQGEDFYFGNFFENKTPEEAMQAYLSELYDLIKKFDDFSVLGHIDLPKRYNQAVAQLNIDVLLPKYKLIFDWLVKNEKGIEINTSGLRQDVKVQFPDQKILELYYACGGRIITLGSDAHTSDVLAKDFNYVVEMLKSIGFESVCTFKNRVVRHHRFDEFEMYL